MLRGSQGKNKTRAVKVADRSQSQEVRPAFTAGHPTKGNMRAKSYGLKDKISMLGTKRNYSTEGL